MRSLNRSPGKDHQRSVNRSPSPSGRRDQPAVNHRVGPTDVINSLGN
jgi:hypothetical protein